MDRQKFLNSAMLPPLELENTWKSLSSPMQTQSNLSHDFFLSSTPTSDQFDSTLTSMVSSPVTSYSNNNMLIKKLAEKLGNICNTNNVANTSCYNTPLNSPPKMVQENFPYLVNSTAFCSSLPTINGDPGFTERAARLTCLGSKSLNGRIAQSCYTSNNFGDHSQTQRASTTPLVNFANSQGENTTKNGDHGDENGTNRKRKAVTKGKVKENDVPLHIICNKEEGNGEEMEAKRRKTDVNGGGEEKKTEENRGDESKKQKQKTVEPPPKDYIHVRARRGQATDSHSLAERVRREKISERMKLLQDLVPGCNKVTGKALMLDEIINYVRSLQRQVEFLSMKLAYVNPRQQFNTKNECVSKDVIQPNSSKGHPMYRIDSLATTLYRQPNQNSLTTTEIATMFPSLNSNPINENSNALQTQLPLLHGFPNLVSQLPSLCEGDLQSIVQMGCGRKENGSQ